MWVLLKTMARRGNCISEKQSCWFILDTRYLRRKNIDSVISTIERSACVSWEGDQYRVSSVDIWNFKRINLSILLDFSLHGQKLGLDNWWKLMLFSSFSCLLRYLIQANQLGSNYCIRYCWLWHCLLVNLECKTVRFGLADYPLYS